MARLTGKIAFITGAAQGIGQAISEAFLKEGAICYLSDIQEDLLAKRVALLGKNAHALPLDVRKEANWQNACQRILNGHGALHVLVNNAGITGFEVHHRPHDPENVTLSDWRDVHETNLDGTFLGCKYAIQTMRKAATEGTIINISSRSGLVGIPGAAAYASSKAAIRNHTKTVALYCAAQGLPITCNSLHPAAILTPMWEPMLGEGQERERRMQKFASDNPSGRFGKPEEVAAVAVLLASNEARYLNGAEITIDGGLLAGAASTPSQTTSNLRQ